MAERRARAVRRFLGVCVVASLVGACSTQVTPTPPASGSTSPGRSPSPGQSSSQALIAADLKAGTIDLGTALEYRAWALFRDPRLPERYDGAGSTGDDPMLSRDIETALPSLSPDLKAALETFLLRPTNPDSPFSRPPTAGITLAGYTAQGTPEPTQCTAPWKWVSDEWSADGSADRGFRVWACATSSGEAEARSDIQTVLSMGTKLWPAMVAAEPNGMGPPVPDTHAKQNDGNGKTDVYLLEDLAQCRQRGSLCQQIEGGAPAVAQVDYPRNCAVSDFPSNACSGYILVHRSYVGTPELAGRFAHEFFHVLQFAHNGYLRGNWYEEASATWAKWNYVAASGPFEAGEKAAAKEATYDNFRKYQTANNSILRFNPQVDSNESTNRYQYQAWVWPLFQTMKDPGGVFLTWSDLEQASSLRLEDIDLAVDRQLPFKGAFHEFAVWNAQPDAYQPPVSTGLDDVRWQEQDRLDDFPEVQHHLTSGPTPLELGKTTQTATIDALAAQYDAYQLSDDAVRQIKIDLTSLTNAANADLDVIAQIRPSPEAPGDHWRRIPGSSGVVQLCRDSPSDNVAYFQVVISNHAVARIGDDPDPRQRIEGQYTVEAKEKCEVPDHLDVTFSGSNLHGDETNSWSGTATFDRVEEGEGSEPGQYGYVLAKGTATWEYRREPHDPRPGASGRATVQLSGAARDFGTCELVTASEDPSRAMTLYCLVTAGEHPIEGTSDSTPEIAENEVYNWIYTNVQRYQAGFTLSGSERREGSNGGFQIWNWTFTPRFDT